MDCNETRRFLEADADGELDLVRHIELDTHLQSCPDCARRAENVRARRAALSAILPRFTASRQLKEKVRAVLHSEGMPALAPSSLPHRSRLIRPLWAVSGLAASLAFALLVGYTWGGARTRGNSLVDEAVSAHVRSLQASHLTDVASTDQHTVKPWFAGKLDFSPPVVDLAGAGFPLAGGRLERLDGRPAGALVFHRRQHVINLFIWPVTMTALSARRAERDGYHIEEWSNDGFNFIAVSEMAATELAQFTDIFRANQHGELPRN